MANYVENLLINDGPSAFNVHTFIQSDGSSGELVNTPIIAASELTPPLGAGMFMSIWEIWYTVTNFTILLGWKTLSGIDRTWVLSPGVDSRMKFHRFGGLMDMSGMYAQGQLVMTTTGFTTTSSYGSFVLRMRKHDGGGSNPKNVGIPQGLPPNEFYSGSDSLGGS